MLKNILSARLLLSLKYLHEQNDKKIKFNEAFDCFQKVMAYADHQGISHLILKEIPRIYAQIPSDELDYFLHLAQANCIKKDVAMVIDYHKALGFEKNRREGLNRAKRHDLKVVCDNNFSGFCGLCSHFIS